MTMSITSANSCDCLAFSSSRLSSVHDFSDGVVLLLLLLLPSSLLFCGNILKCEKICARVIGDYKRYCSVPVIFFFQD